MLLKKMQFAVLVLVLIFAVTAIQAQDTQYAQGLLLDYYVIQNADDVEGPKGRSMATLIDTSVPQMSYLVPFEIEPALEQFRDNLWGLQWSGFLKVDDPGPYSFNLLVNTAAESNTHAWSITCRSWLKIQDRVIASHELKRFLDGNQNAYGNIDLRPGIYDFEVWFACSEHGSRTNPDNARPNLTVNVRGPNDAMLRPIPRNQLLHEI